MPICTHCRIVFLDGEHHVCPTREPRYFAALAVGAVPLAIGVMIAMSRANYFYDSDSAIIILFVAVVLAAVFAGIASNRGEWK